MILRSVRKLEVNTAHVTEKFGLDEYEREASDRVNR